MSGTLQSSAMSQNVVNLLRKAIVRQLKGACYDF